MKESIYICDVCGKTEHYSSSDSVLKFDLSKFDMVMCSEGHLICISHLKDNIKTEQEYIDLQINFDGTHRFGNPYTVQNSISKIDCPICQIKEKSD